MRYFIVTVHPKRVQIQERIRELNTFDASAIVDGDIWRYKIKKSASTSHKDTGWRGRAYPTIHYHAKNSGTVIKFEPVHHSSRRKRKIHEKQLSFW